MMCYYLNVHFQGQTVKCVPRAYLGWETCHSLPPGKDLEHAWSPSPPYDFMASCLPVTFTCLHRYKHNFRGWQNFRVVRIIVTSIESVAGLFYSTTPRHVRWKHTSIKDDDVIKSFDSTGRVRIFSAQSLCFKTHPTRRNVRKWFKHPGIW